MAWTNYHTHCYLCDGHGRPEDYVAEAIRQGAWGLGFSCHAPLPFETAWNMKAGDLEPYCRLVRDLGKAHIQDLPLFLGLEIDFIPEVIGPNAPLFQAANLDFTIGAVHFVGQDGDGVPWTVDGPPDQFACGLKSGYGGDIRRVAETFYALVRKMVETDCPDIIAHFDLVKKNNSGGKYFSEDAPWYRRAVFETLDVIAASGAILEVNTGGIVRKRTDALYPSAWILERCLELDIPLTLNADAHEPQHVTSGFAGAARVLLEVGYRELYTLRADGWQPQPFTPDGLQY